MNSKIFVSSKNTITISTHDGSFSFDEVLAFAILCINYSDHTLEIIRTRDIKRLKELNILVNVSNIEKSKNIIYHSVQYIWDDCCKCVCTKVIKDFSNLFHFSSDSHLDHIIQKFIFTYKLNINIFSFLNLFNSPWNCLDYNNYFENALQAIIPILKADILQNFSNFYPKAYIEAAIYGYYKVDNFLTYSSYPFYNGILHLQDKKQPWIKEVLDSNSNFPKNHPFIINFVIFYDNDTDEWVAQCVPISLTELSKSRIPFYKGLFDSEGKDPKYNNTYLEKNSLSVRAKVSKETSDKEIIDNLVSICSYSTTYKLKRCPS